MGSNQTVQAVLNKGYTVIAVESVNPSFPAAQIPAHDGTNKIVIIVSCDAGAVDQPIYLGDSTENGNGLPLIYSGLTDDGSGGIMSYPIPLPIEILTSKPEDFYVYSAGPSQTVRILYLSEIE